MRISDWSSDVCSSDLQRIANRHLGHVLQDLARHGTDVGATVAANLGFIAHTTQSHAYKLSIGCARNGLPQRGLAHAGRSEEHTSELQSLMRNSYAVFCLKKKK